MLDLKDLLRFYVKLVGARVRGQMQYRVSFGLATVSSAVANIIEFGAIVVLFNRVPRIAGWSLWEAALLYALAETSASPVGDGSGPRRAHLCRRLRQGGHWPTVGSAPSPLRSSSGPRSTIFRNASARAHSIAC